MGRDGIWVQSWTWVKKMGWGGGTCMCNNLAHWISLLQAFSTKGISLLKVFSIKWMSQWWESILWWRVISCQRGWILLLLHLPLGGEKVCTEHFNMKWIASPGPPPPTPIIGVRLRLPRTQEHLVRVKRKKWGHRVRSNFDLQVKMSKYYQNFPKFGTFRWKKLGIIWGQNIRGLWVTVHNFVKKYQGSLGEIVKNMGLWVRAMLKMGVLTALHTYHLRYAPPPRLFCHFWYIDRWVSVPDPIHQNLQNWVHCGKFGQKTEYTIYSKFGIFCSNLHRACYSDWSQNHTFRGMPSLFWSLLIASPWFFWRHPPLTPPPPAFPGLFSDLTCLQSEWQNYSGTV